MSYNCPYCTKTFEKEQWATNHVKRKHAAYLRLQIQNRQVEKLKLNIIAHKITKVPDFFNIPSEYLGVLTAID